MTTSNIYFVKKGISEPRIGLRDQGVVSFGLAKKYANELAVYSWTEADTKEGEDLTEALGTKVAVQAESKIASKGATSSEQAIKSAAKELIGKIRIGADLVLTKQEVPNVTKESLQSGGPLGRSTAKIAMYLAKIQPAVTLLDEHLKPYFQGQSASEQVLKSLKDLDAAQSEQEVGLSSLPQETLKIYETKGRLLAKIEELNKIAKLAFWGQSEILSQFNKDILNRARKSKKKQEEEVPDSE